MSEELKVRVSYKCCFYIEGTELLGIILISAFTGGEGGWLKSTQIALALQSEFPLALKLDQFVTYLKSKRLCNLISVCDTIYFTNDCRF